MKKLIALMAMGLALGFTACSDDDDAANFETPKYESEAKKLELKESQQYESIELTASGNYIITTKGASYAPARATEANKRFSMFVSPFKSVSRSANTVYGNIIYGKYTKNVDGSYNLEGFGTISITSDEEDDTLVTMTRNGETSTLRASVVEQKMSGSLTDKLCRTWAFAGLRCTLTINGKKYIDAKGATLKEFMKDFESQGKKYGMDLEDMDWECDEEVTLENVIFTKSGTYVVTYTNDMIGVSFWKWKSEKNQTIYYSWDNNFDTHLAGDCKLEFTNDGHLYIIEQKGSFDDEEDDDEEEDDDDYSYEIKMYTILKELKE